MSEIQKIEKWYKNFSSELEDKFPGMDGYIAYNNIKWLIDKVKKSEKD